MLLFSTEKALATDCLVMYKYQKVFFFGRFSAILMFFSKKVTKIFGWLLEKLYLCTR